MSAPSRPRAPLRAVGLVALALSLVGLLPVEAHAKPFPWRALTIDAALKAARKESKPLVVDVYAVWCEPCERLERLVFGSPEVGALAPRLIAIRVDAEKDGGPAVVRRFRVERYPTTLFLRSDGSEWGRIEGFRELPGYLETLRAFLDGKGSADAPGSAPPLASDTNTPIIARFAKAYRSAANMEPHAEGLLATIEDEDTSGVAGVRDQATLARAELITELGRPDEAMRLLEPLIRRAAAPLAADAAYALAKAHARAGDATAGARLLEKRARKAKDPAAAWRLALYCTTTEGAPTTGAQRVVETALRRHPESDLLWDARADLDEAAGQPAEALDAVMKAAALRPDLPYYQERAARLRTQAPAREGAR